MVFTSSMLLLPLVVCGLLSHNILCCCLLIHFMLLLSLVVVSCCCYCCLMLSHVVSCCCCCCFPCFSLCCSSPLSCNVFFSFLLTVVVGEWWSDAPCLSLLPVLYAARPSKMLTGVVYCEKKASFPLSEPPSVQVFKFGAGSRLCGSRKCSSL